MNIVAEHGDYYRRNSELIDQCRLDYYMMYLFTHSAKTEAENTMMSILADLKKDSSKFPELCKKHSECKAYTFSA